MPKINEGSNPGLFRKQMILEVIIVEDNFLAEKRESCSVERVERHATKPVPQWAIDLNPLAKSESQCRICTSVLAHQKGKGKGCGRSGWRFRCLNSNSFLSLASVLEGSGEGSRLQCLEKALRQKKDVDADNLISGWY